MYGSHLSVNQGSGLNVIVLSVEAKKKKSSRITVPENDTVSICIQCTVLNCTVYLKGS